MLSEVTMFAGRRRGTAIEPLRRSVDGLPGVLWLIPLGAVALAGLLVVALAMTSGGLPVVPDQSTGRPDQETRADLLGTHEPEMRPELGPEIGTARLGTAGAR